MTLIEFFDRSPIDNIIGTLLLRPEQVIFVGFSNDMNEQKKLYEELLRARGIRTEILVRNVNRNQLSETVEAFEEIVTTYPDCVFDLEGGDEIYLIAVGIIYERYKNIRFQRINLLTDRVQDLDEKTKDPVIQGQDLSLEEYLGISGGEIVYTRNNCVKTYDWRMDQALKNRIHVLWDICLQDIGRWNSTINTLDKVGDLFQQKGKPTWRFFPDNARQALAEKGDRYYLNNHLMSRLANERYILDLIMNGDQVSFRFRDETVERILTNAGQILELWVAAVMMDIQDPKVRGKALYHDVKVGVHIDWNQNDNDNTHQTVNEIDVLAMKKNVPVFISCKNGGFTVDELYKLQTVAKRFGGEYAIVVLVASHIDEDDHNAKYILTRANDMGIRVIKNEDVASYDAFKRKLQSI